MVVSHQFVKALFLTTALFLVACQKDKIGTTFGIRHDRAITDYEAAARNVSPYNDTVTAPNFAPVVAFTYGLNGTDNGEYIASGVLIDEEWVLTAGHNFYVGEEQNEPALVGGITVHFGDNIDAPQQSVGVAELVFHPTWIAVNEDFYSGNDVCLVRLAQKVNHPTAPWHGDFQEQVGQDLWFAGYGDYAEVYNPNNYEFSPRHAVQNVLDRIKTGVESELDGQVYDGGILAFDFDHPDGSINTFGDDFSARDESFIGDGSSDAQAKDLEGTTVQGDSGGPLFARINNRWQVVGILSGGIEEPIRQHADSDYGDVSVFIRTSEHADWIEQVVQ